MNKWLLAVTLSVASVGMTSGRALAWAPGTHAYLADHSGKKTGLRNYNEMYGAMVPDLFNSSFELIGEPATAQCIRFHTHGYPLPPAAPPEDFLELWNLAGSGLEQNAAYGFVGHNDVWGADSFAHWTTTAGTRPGYIVAKAQVLVAAIHAQKDASGKSAWDYLGIPPNPNPGPDPLADPATLVTHFVLELAGDVIVKRHDPSIGLKLSTAALVRSDAFRDLLVDVLEPCVGATAAAQAEASFREQIFQRGLVMLGTEKQILSAFVTQLVADSPAFYAAVTGRPFDAGLLPLVTTLSETTLAASLQMIQSDYMPEINTLAARLDGLLAANGIAY